MNLERKDTFVVRIKIRDDQGRVVDEVETIRFAGLLHLAHEEGLRSVTTELLQNPSESNPTAVVKATVRTRRGTFTGIGDANPSNVNRRIAPHIIRMAETRAIARALRVAVNSATVCLEELGEGSDEGVSDKVTATTANNAAAAGPAPSRRTGRDRNPEVAEPNDERLMTDEQRKYLFRLAYTLGETSTTAAQRVLASLRATSFEKATRAMAAHAIDALKAEIASGQIERTTNGDGHHAG